VNVPAAGDMKIESQILHLCRIPFTSVESFSIYVNGDSHKFFVRTNSSTDRGLSCPGELYYRVMKRKQKPSRCAPDPATLAPKASGGDLVLHSRTIGALPIVTRLIQRCGLREILSRHLPAEDGGNRIETSNAILLLVRNILITLNHERSDLESRGGSSGI
jgi:hypothetical protein